MLVQEARGSQIRHSGTWILSERKGEGRKIEKRSVLPRKAGSTDLQEEWGEVIIATPESAVGSLAADGYPALIWAPSLWSSLTLWTIFPRYELEKDHIHKLPHCPEQGCDLGAMTHRLEREPWEEVTKWSWFIEVLLLLVKDNGKPSLSLFSVCALWDQINLRITTHWEENKQLMLWNVQNRVSFFFTYGWNFVRIKAVRPVCMFTCLSI